MAGNGRGGNSGVREMGMVSEAVGEGMPTKRTLSPTTCTKVALVHLL